MTVNAGRKVGLGDRRVGWQECAAGTLCAAAQRYVSFLVHDRPDGSVSLGGLIRVADKVQALGLLGGACERGAWAGRAKSSDACVVGGLLGRFEGMR